MIINGLIFKSRTFYKTMQLLYICIYFQNPLIDVLICDVNTASLPDPLSLLYDPPSEEV